MPIFNDSDTVRRLYETDEKLRIRQEIHEKYTIPRKNYVEWVLKTIPWRGKDRILDIGCGPGTYYHKMQLRDDLKEVDYFGIDLSPGMLSKHPSSNGLSLGDAVQLPYASSSFNIVMANHMLYHVPDIEKAITEIRRVLKPEGVLAVATNGVTTMPELQVLLRRAIVLLTRQGQAQIHPPEPASNLFALENGTRILARNFFAVVRHDFPSKLVFTEIDPAIAYLESTRDMREPQLPDDVMWEDVMMIMRQQITQLINHLGSLEIEKTTGVLMASDKGGFIEPFIKLNSTKAES